MNRKRTPTISLLTTFLVLSLAPAVQAISITHLEGDGYSWLEAEVDYGDNAIGSLATSNYFIPDSGILSLTVARVATGYDCYLWPDDVPEGDSFFLPLDFGQLHFTANYFSPGYWVRSNATGFSLSSQPHVDSEEVPDGASTGAMLTLSLLGLIAVRKFRFHG